MPCRADRAARRAHRQPRLARGAIDGGQATPLPGEEPRGVAPRTRELPHGTISGEEGASSSAAVRSDGRRRHRHPMPKAATRLAGI